MPSLIEPYTMLCTIYRGERYVPKMKKNNDYYVGFKGAKLNKLIGVL